MLVYQVLDRARRPLAWGLLIGGLAAVAAVLFGALPPFGGDSWGVRIANAVAWLLVALEGYGHLREDIESEVEE